MKFLILLFSVLSIGIPINAALPVNKTYTVFKRSNPIFDKYKKSFEALYYKHTKKKVDTSSININLVEEPSFYCNKRSNCATPLEGLCATRGDGGTEIFISKARFKRHNKYQREELVFHELAHCALGYDHRNFRYNNTYISLMGPEMFSDPYFYKNHREALIIEMFTGNIDGIIAGMLDESN